MTQVPYGWLIRSIHVWCANFFIAAAGIHFLSVLLSKAYRKPRELTWVSGLLLLSAALAFGFSGYLLPWNELSYYATLVGTRIPDVIPGLGEYLVYFLRGGQQVTGATLTRFFAVHVTILPLVFMAILVIHLTLVQVQGMSVPLGLSDADVRDRRPFFSEILLIESCIWLVLFGLLVTLAVLLPAEVGDKADMLKPAPEGIKPEWYFLSMFKTLKLIPEALGVAIFSLGAVFLFLVPFLDRRASRGERSRGFTAAFTILLLGVVALEILAMADPGVQRAPEILTAETYNVWHGALSLVMLWTVIGFLVFYLRQLLRQNTRIRSLYR
jgi:cytochrome b6